MATTKSIGDLTTITIVLDAAYDLSQASYDRDEADDFAAAYLGCAERISERSGVRVEVAEVNDCYTGVQSHEAGRSEDDRGLWQSIHDCVSRGDDGEWTYSEAAADKIADRLAADVADEVAALIVERSKAAVRESVAEAMSDESDTLRDRVAELLADRLDA